MYAPVGNVRAVGPGYDTETQHRIPALTQHGPGHYRIRVQARGRDAEANANPPPIKPPKTSTWKPSSTTSTNSPKRST